MQVRKLHHRRCMKNDTKIHDLYNLIEDIEIAMFTTRRADGRLKQNGECIAHSPFIMPKERLELSWGHPRAILSRVRLPFRHFGPN